MATARRDPKNTGLRLEKNAKRGAFARFARFFAFVFLISAKSFAEKKINC